MPYLEPDEHVRELRTMDRLLTAEEVADRLGMRTDWVWAQARAGRIPHVRLGRYGRFESRRWRPGSPGSRPPAQSHKPRARFRLRRSS